MEGSRGLALCGKARVPEESPGESAAQLQQGVLETSVPRHNHPNQQQL